MLIRQKFISVQKLSWRQNFRKVSFDDARDVVNNLGKDLSHNLIEGLDDKFWVWETLEEATRPHLDRLEKDESL